MSILSCIRMSHVFRYDMTDKCRPILDTSPRNAALSKLFCELYSDSITEDVYDASLAELSYNLFYAGEHIFVAAGGFSDKLAVLTETMLEKLKNYKVDSERFAKIKETVCSFLTSRQPS